MTLRNASLISQRGILWTGRVDSWRTIGCSSLMTFSWWPMTLAARLGLRWSRCLGVIVHEDRWGVTWSARFNFLWNYTIYTWWFPEIGVYTPKSSTLVGFSIINQPFLGMAPFMEPPVGVLKSLILWGQYNSTLLLKLLRHAFTLTWMLD